jgi:hypothetical protein
MAKLLTRTKWKEIQTKAEAGIEYSELAETYKIPRKSILSRSQAEQWRTVDRVRKQAKAAPPEDLASPKFVQESEEIPQGIILPGGIVPGSPEFLAYLQRLGEMEPAEFAKNYTRIAQVKMARGLVNWEATDPQTLAELKIWADLQKRMAEFGKVSGSQALTLTVNAPRSLSRQRGPVVDVVPVAVVAEPAELPDI